MTAEAVRRLAAELKRAERERSQRQHPDTAQPPADSPSSRTTTANPRPPPASTPLATEAGRSRNAGEEAHHHQHHQKRNTSNHRLLPSPPRPAREAQQEERARRSTFTTSPAQRPERRKEGKDQNQLSAAIVAVFDDAGEHTHLTNPLYTHGEVPELPPHLTAPKRQSEAEGSGGTRRRKLELASRRSVASSLL